MKRSIVLWLRRCQFPLMVLLSAIPLLLTFLSIHAPDMLDASGALFALYLLVSGVCLAVPGARRLPAAWAGTALLVLLCAALMPVWERPLLLLVPVVLAGLLFFSLPIAARRYESEVPPFFYVTGISIHIVVQFLHYYFSIGGASPYAPVDGMLTASLMGYLLLLLLSMNRISLDNASLARHHIPEGMRRMNTAMTLVFLACSLVLALMPAVVRGITALWQALRHAVGAAVEFLLSLLPSSPDSLGGLDGAPQGIAGFPLENAEPSALARMLEKIASVLSFVILLVGFVVLIRMLVSFFIRVYRALIARMRLYMEAASTEYEDEITDTREDGAAREIRFLRREKRRAQEDARTPQGRIRQEYARLLRRNPDWGVSSTARENLPGGAARIYERARYSDHSVTNEDAEQFSRGVRRK